MSDVQVYYTGNMALGRSSAEERDFGAHANKVVLASDYADLESQHALLKEKADRMAEALKDAKKTVEKRFLECGRQGANAHMTNPLRTEWEHCRATLHEIDAALAAYQAGTGVVDAKEKP